jgi:hypothetical protein
MDQSTMREGGSVVMWQLMSLALMEILRLVLTLFNRFAHERIPPQPIWIFLE